MTKTRPALPPISGLRTAIRILLGLLLVLAGTSHLSFAREPFRAQVPDFVPVDKDTTVLASGVAEISLGTALVLLGRRRVAVGWIAAAFFTAIFPGNISQWIERRSAFGLDSDEKRMLRLLGQPLLVATALWSTGALRGRRR